ncbi:immunoglobulin-like domain-containing protein [Paenibacillus sp. CECT 9249]|uniref:immunoglobulin-like domain-containing protein n=1 Tax=Paenibacillus sp. CECT 9249 TaxID=2845385 RepID=UPI001E4EBE5E|nr:immunoglobulin-like domain-containing protein [Paenibacillus sp. CECT 9249]
MRRKSLLSFVLAILIAMTSLTGFSPQLVFAVDREAIVTANDSDGQSVTESVYDLEELPVDMAGLMEMETQISGSTLILHYDMRTAEQSGGQLVMKDVSGSGFDGLFKNAENGQFVHDDKAGFVSFNGGGASSRSGYIEIPKGRDGSDVLRGLDDVTVSAIVNWDNDGQNRWFFGLGTVTDDAENGNKYFFVTPRHGNGNVMATGVSKSGWRNEALIKGAEALPAGTWKLVTAVYSSSADTISLYVDGVMTVSGSAKGIKLADLIDPTAGFSGFIGKSIFKNDNYYKGSVGDFRIYSGALTEQEIAGLYAEAAGTIADIRQLAMEDAAASLDMEAYLGAGDESAEAVTKHLSLPAKGKHGTNIAWTSSNEEVIANNGTVTRPGADAADATVELTAHLSYEELAAARKFTVTVLKEFSDEQIVAADAAKLSIHNAENIKGNIGLAAVGENGSTIVWASSDPQIVKGTAEAGAAGDPKLAGRVTRPAGDTQVTLTATVAKGSAATQRTFDITVKASPEAIDYDAYFFAYFTGEYEGGEEISFATAEDPLKWRSLNNGQSIIQSTMGERGLRDPFIIRSPEGDQFYLLATDLKMGESTNFDQAQITGSHSIMIWESDDLVNWSEQRMVEVAPKKGGNTWAPEAFYDENTGDYVVFWASSMKVEDTYGKYPNGRPVGQYNVMYYATTRDFYTFSEPKVYTDEAFPTIDTTMIEHNGTLYRFTKSEVGYKVYYEKADNIFYDKDGIAGNGYQFEPIAGTRNGIQGMVGHAGNNEGPTVFKDLREDKWYMFLDSWPYHVRVSTDLEDGSQFMNNLLPASDYGLPPGPRHGTVIPITRAEYDALQLAYGKPGPALSEDPVVHYTFDPDDVEGQTVKDVSGNGYDAALVGGAKIVTEDKVGASGGSVELDGSTGFVELPPNLIKDLNLEAMTIATWVKADKNQGNQRIFDFASETGRAVNRNTMYLSTQGDAGGLEFAIVTPFTEKFANDSSTLGAAYKYALRAPRLEAGGWHHVAMTIDGFDAVLFVNGQEAARSSVYNVEPRMLLETTVNYIGKSRKAGQSLFDGKFDEFRIYNRALSGEEVATLADQETKPPVDPPVLADPILHYDMSLIEGTKVVDQAGKFDGTWINPENAVLMKSDNAGAISFTGSKDKASYIEIPQGVLDGLTDMTVSALANWNGANEAEWVFAFGQDQNKYIYVTPKRNSGDRSARLGLGITSWTNEAGANASTGSLKSGEWKLVTAVMSGTENTLTLYVDGVEVGSGSANGYTLAQINNNGGRSGFIGKSFYAADPYFGGMIADFQVYGSALTASDIRALQTEAGRKIAAMDDLVLHYAAERLDYDDFIGDNASKDEITGDLALPDRGEYGTTIAWESRDADIITHTGKVNRPSADEGNRAVVLVATLSDGKRAVTKEFTVTVLRKPTDFEAAKLDAETLIVRNIHDVRGNLTLPQAGAHGSVISWSSEYPGIITPTGEVTRPAHGSGDVAVRLTATITAGGVTVTKAFIATVREMPVEEEYAGYAFTYFTGEGYANGEQIYFALSEGDDPLHWKELNGGNPALTSDLGEKGLRDPFMIRSPEGDKFYLIATDLKIYGNGDWDRAQRYGSRSIMVWESTDLVHWSNQRMVEVAPPEAGSTWAPEAFYDKSTGEYVVFWASKLYDNPNHSGNSYHRMMYAKTRDFYTFTEPAVYMDYGYSVIDTTMIEHDGKVYRITKDERSNTSSSPNGKFVFQEAGDSIFDPNFVLLKEGIGKGSIRQGEGPTVFKANGEDKWYLFIDEFGGRGYVPFETTDLSSGVWTMSSGYELPSRPRHGTVLPVTQSEYDRLSAQVPGVEEPHPGVRVESVTLDREEAELAIGKELQLTATISPSNADDPSVVWSSSDETVAAVDAAGKVTALKEGISYVSVTTVDGGFTAIGKIVVKQDATPEIIPVTGVALNQTKASLREGAQLQLTATVLPQDATDKTVTWASSDEKAVTVDATGKITALRAGTATITVTTADGGYQAECVVTVEKRSSGGGDGGSGSGGGGGTTGSQPDSAEDKAEEQEPEQESGQTPEPGSEPETPPVRTEFADTKGHWAAGYIAKLASNRIMEGYPDGTFGPNRPMSRAELIAVICRLLGLEAVQGEFAFTDTRPDAWYAGFANAAHEAGIVQGYADGTLQPNRNVTREEAFAMLYRALNKRLETSNRETVRFADHDDISAWAKEAVQALVQAQAVKGYPDGTLQPKGHITRAEAAAVLIYFLP